MTLRRCTLTVISLMPSLAAICLFGMPQTTNRNTCCSRVRPRPRTHVLELALQTFDALHRFSANYLGERPRLVAGGVGAEINVEATLGLSHRDAGRAGRSRW